MTVTVPDDVRDRLRTSHMLGIFVRVDLEEPICLWLGVQDIPARIPSIDPDGTVYQGGGRLNGVPEFEAVVNGIADRADFLLSGVDPVEARELDPDDYPVRGKAVHVGITTLDDKYQPMSSIIPLVRGKASRVFKRRPPVTGTENPSVTFGMSVGFGITTRSRESAVLWNSAFQKGLYPGDKFCDGTARLDRGVEVEWPAW